MRKVTDYIFITLCLVGIALCVSEPVFHHSVCNTEGCKLAAESLRFKYSFNLIGTVVFSCLILLDLFKCRRVMHILIAASISSEGFLIAYQRLVLSETCHLCMAIAAIFFGITVLKLIAADEKTGLISGIVGLVSIITLSFFMHPSQACIPSGDRLILFYSNECPHCHELINECKCCRIKVQTLPVKRYSRILKALGIKDVPVLLINDSREKKIIVGKKKIEEYLKLANQDVPILHPYTGFMVHEAHPQDACSLEEPCTRKSRGKNYATYNR